MKKKIVVISVVVIVFFMMLSCNHEKEVVKMATGSIGGAYYPIGSSIAELLSDEIDEYIFNAYTGQASLSNSKMIKEGSVDLGIIQSNVSEWAYNGDGMFENNAVKNLRGIASLYPEMIQVIVTDKSDMNNIKDLSGKRISLGLKESGNYLDALNILSAYGLTTDDFEAKYLSFSDAVEAIKNQEIDGVFITSGVPAASVVLMESMVDIKLLSIEGEIQEYLVETYPYYTKSVIPKDSYGSLIKDLDTISTPALWVCDASLSDDLVYEITKRFWENLDRLRTSHPSMDELTIEKYKLGMSIPIHPGAQRYYDEKKMD